MKNERCKTSLWTWNWMNFKLWISFSLVALLSSKSHDFFIQATICCCICRIAFGFMNRSKPSSMHLLIQKIMLSGCCRFENCWKKVHFGWERLSVCCYFGKSKKLKFLNIAKVHTSLSRKSWIFSDDKRGNWLQCCFEWSLCKYCVNIVRNSKNISLTLWARIPRRFHFNIFPKRCFWRQLWIRQPVTNRVNYWLGNVIYNKSENEDVHGRWIKLSWIFL